MSGVPGLPGPLLKAKFRAMFRALDAARDGLLNKNDFHVIGMRAVQYGGMSTQQAEAFITTFGTGIWRKIIGASGDEATYTEEAFVDHMTRRNATVEERPGRFSVYDAGWELVFEAADFDKDGLIMVDDLTKFFRIVGVPAWLAPLVFVASEGRGDGLLRPHDLQQTGREYLRLDEPHSTQILFGPLDLEHRSQTAPQNPLQIITKHWITRISRLFFVLDVDKDGAFTLQDLELLRRRLLTLARSRSPQLEELTHRACSRLWLWLLGAANQTLCFSQAEFVTAVLRQLSVAPADEFFGAVDMLFEVLFLACDKSRGQRLDADDLHIYYLIFQLRENSARALAQMDVQHRGFLYRAEFKELGRAVFRSTTPGPCDWLLGQPSAPVPESPTSPSGFTPGPQSPRRKKKNDCVIS